jgi:hypothetical protein
MSKVYVYEGDGLWVGVVLLQPGAQVAMHARCALHACMGQMSQMLAACMIMQDAVGPALPAALHLHTGWVTHPCGTSCTVDACMCGQGHLKQRWIYADGRGKTLYTV